MNVEVKQDYGLDSNSNGLYDDIALELSVEVPANATYNVSGMLYKNNKCVGYAAKISEFVNGTNEVTLPFSCLYLRNEQQAGPYTFGLIISKQDEERPVFINDTLYTTQDYKLEDFEVSPVKILSISAETFDEDADGVGDSLKCSLTLNATQAVNASIQGNSVTKDLKVQNEISQVLSAGNNTVSLSLNGTRIRQSGINSPYEFMFKIFDERGIHLGSQNVTFNNLHYADFGFSNICLTNNYSEKTVDLDSDGRDDLLQVGIGVQVKKKGMYFIEAFVEGNVTSHKVVNEVLLSTGNTTIWLPVQAETLRQAGFNQGFRIKGLILKDENGQIYGQRVHPYTTQPYTGADFDPPRIELTGDYMLQATDANNNNLIDSLALQVGMAVHETGIYEISGHLKCGKAKKFTHSIETLEPGQRNATLIFSGKDIQAFGFDGSYQFERIGILHHDIYLDNDRGPILTRSFNFDEFEASTTKDTDNDGVMNHEDSFPSDPAAAVDTDGDRHPDHWNETKSQSDSTNDPVLRLDTFPNDPAASMDSDGDGYPDTWNEGMTAADSTTSLSLDIFPNDPEKWEEPMTDTDQDGVPDQWDECPGTPVDSVTNSSGCAQELNCDINGDGLFGLEEIIRGLQVLSAEE